MGAEVGKRFTNLEMKNVYGTFWKRTRFQQIEELKQMLCKLGFGQLTSLGAPNTHFLIKDFTRSTKAATGQDRNQNLVLIQLK